MDAQQLLAFSSFAVASAASPGPNNIMLMTSGANVGFKRTIPHMLGIIFGFSFMIVLVGFGLMGVFNQYPATHQVLQIVCLVYLFYLAVKIATSTPASDSYDNYQPMSFLSAANFQWMNPKAWSMAVTAIGVYNVSATWHGIALISFGFALINVPTVGVWTLAGQKLQKLLSKPTHARWFNYSMAGLLLLSALMML